MKIWKGGISRHKQRTIRFWRWSGSRSGSRNFWTEFLPPWRRCGLWMLRFSIFS